MMADKKKKIFLSKESPVPRRPVILKSDRDVSKEQAKEKVEKEKQPMIILKTREQSTPKEERPHSPKTSFESDGPYPSRIAQNENKEKKTIETKIAPPLKQMSEPVKLIDENLEFNSAALEFLHDSSNNYLVVGVIGTQGVGKSMILNLLAQDLPMEDICEKIVHSHAITNDQDIDTSTDVTIETQMENLNFAEVAAKKQLDEKIKSFMKFKMQDIEQIEKGVMCTKGVDMFITSNRVILLDCQAFCSPSSIEETNIGTIPPRNANIVTVDCLQIASYLISVCHVVIAVQDWIADYNFLRYVQTAEMLKPSLSASSASAGAEHEVPNGESQPHLLLLHNRCRLEDYTPAAIRAVQALYRKVFQKSNLQLQSGMYMYSDANRNGAGAGGTDGADGAYAADRCGAPLNLFLLPDIYDDYDNPDIYRGHPSFEKLAYRLRWMILGVHRHQITNVPNLSERGWFHYCNKAWDTIKKCTFFMEYERLLP